MNDAITIKPAIKVPVERVAYTLCAALEGGSNYWIEGQTTNFDNMPAGVEWAHEAIAHGAQFIFKIFEEDDYQKPEKTVAEALVLMATDHATHFKDMINENEDAETGDILFQLICFGEIVYG